MVRGWTLFILLGATLVWGEGPADAAVRDEIAERAPAVRLERPSDATTAAIDELLELSGLRAQLEAIAAGIRLQFEASPGRLNAQDRALIDGIVTRHFAPEILHARIRLEVGRRVDPAALEKALVWFRSALGRRITRAEITAIGGGSSWVPLPSDERLALIERLDERGGASETALDVAMAVARSLLRAAEPLRPARLRLGSDQLESEMARVRAQALAPVRITCLRNMLLAYRELTDPELGEYVRFVESHAGQWYIATMNQTLVDAVSVTAELAAVELVTLLPQATREPR